MTLQANEFLKGVLIMLIHSAGAGLEGKYSRGFNVIDKADRRGASPLTWGGTFNIANNAQTAAFYTCALLLLLASRFPLPAVKSEDGVYVS